MTDVHQKRTNGQTLLKEVFYNLHIENPDYFKMHEKYAINIEKSIFNEAIKETKYTNDIVSWDNVHFANRYCSIFRRVKANLTYTNAAPELIQRLVDKEFPPTKIASMLPWEMAPTLTAKINAEIAETFKRDHWNPESKPKQETRTDGLFQCGKCRGYNISTRQVQTRSADEGMCVFATCVDCGKKWKM
jgi:DNA-directed RNA polymerase subunit M/transcription elongation factor TFIIS